MSARELTLDERIEIAADYLGCSVDECLYCYDTSSGDSVFNEPFGSEITISVEGEIVSDLFALKWCVVISDTDKHLIYKSEKIARKAYEQFGIKNKCLLFQQVRA